MCQRHTLVGAILWRFDIVEAVILVANESHDEGLEYIVVDFCALGGGRGLGPLLPPLLFCLLGGFLLVIHVLLFGFGTELAFKGHAVAVDEEDPLIHLKVFDVQRCEQLDELDCFYGEVCVFCIHVFALLDFENTNELIKQVWPQLSQSLSQGIKVQSHQHDSRQKQQEEPLLDIAFGSLLEDFNHFLQQLIELTQEIIIGARENEEGNSLHCIALLNKYSVRICEEASLHVPLFHLQFKHFFWFDINEILYDFLPLLQIDHARGEELIIAEEINNLFFVRSGHSIISIDLMRPFNNRSQEVSNELIHHIF